MWAILQRFRDGHGSKRVALLRREHVLAILDGRPPFAERNWLRALRPLLDFAVSIKWIAENPTTDIKVGHFIQRPTMGALEGLSHLPSIGAIVLCIHPARARIVPRHRF